MPPKARILDLRQFNGKPGASGQALALPLSPQTLAVDWARIVLDLEAAGYTQRAIARECGFDDREADMNGKAWVNKLKTGLHSQPKFHNGALLLGLWVEAMRSTIDSVPKLSNL